MSNQQYEAAAKAFDSILTGYPTFQYIDDVRIQDGQAYIYSDKFPEAIDRLSKAITSKTHPEIKPQALYYTGLAQFYQGEKANDKNSFGQAVTTMGSLIDLLTKTPSPDTNSTLESALYYRALSYYERDEYSNAEKDLIQLTQSPQFASSLNRPDYLLRLGDVYRIETNDAVKAKRPDTEIRALADKALAAFDQVAKDPNALVQANDANMSEAGVLFLIAQLDTGTAGYEKALNVFRRVVRKADLIPIQQNRLDELRRQAQAQAQALAAQPGAHSSLSNDFSLLIEREQTRLDKLKNGPDPVIQALIGIAECYGAMKQPDEARTIFHRLIAHAELTPDQQKTVDFQTLYSYVLGGQFDQADKALSNYLSKHSGDPDADGISYQMAVDLMKRKDYENALKQADRSLKDFPAGKYVGDAVALKARALTGLGQIEESNKVGDDFLKANPNSPQANSLLLSRATNESNTGDLAGALADNKKVRDNPSATSDLKETAGAGYIQTLNSMKRYDDVLAEAKAFESKYPQSKMLPSVEYFAAVASSRKHDPAAVGTLQDIAKKYPKDEVAPFALVTVVSIYKEAGDSAAMIKAAHDLRENYPDAYGIIASANDLVTDTLLKEKKFDDAVALYEPLVQAPKLDVAAQASNKIGSILSAAAKSLGYYQSMPLAMRGEAETRLKSAEQAYLTTLKNFPDQLNAVGDAFEGLVNLAKQRRSWGLLKDSEMADYLANLSADFTSPEMQARFELAKAGLVFVTKDGSKQYGTALDTFKKIIAANPNLRLTRRSTNQYGELLLATKDYTDALKVYGDLLDGALPNDEISKGDAYYGLGAASLGLDDVAKARDYFQHLTSLPNGGMWHPHIQDANYGIAYADEKLGNAADLETARQIYSGLMQSAQAGPALQAKAMLGYGRLLEKSGNVIKPTAAGPAEYAIHYFQEPHTLFGPAAPEQSAEGLFYAGQAFEKIGDKTQAKAQYQELIKNYATTAPDWVAKVQAAEAKL